MIDMLLLVLMLHLLRFRFSLFSFLSLPLQHTSRCVVFASTRKVLLCVDLGLRMRLICRANHSLKSQVSTAFFACRCLPLLAAAVDKTK